MRLITLLSVIIVAELIALAFAWNGRKSKKKQTKLFGTGLFVLAALIPEGAIAAIAVLGIPTLFFGTALALTVFRKKNDGSSNRRLTSKEAKYGNADGKESKLLCKSRET